MRHLKIIQPILKSPFLAVLIFKKDFKLQVRSNGLLTGRQHVMVSFSLIAIQYPLPKVERMKMDFGLYIRAGERGYTLERLFNLREGIKKDKDTLSKRFTDTPLIKGDEKSIVPLKEMLPKYYKIRGWDENDVPTQKTLKKLGLSSL